MNSFKSVNSAETLSGTLESLLAEHQHYRIEITNPTTNLRDFGKEMLLWSDTDGEKTVEAEKWVDGVRFETKSIESVESRSSEGGLATANVVSVCEKRSVELGNVAGA